MVHKFVDHNFVYRVVCTEKCSRWGLGLLFAEREEDGGAIAMVREGISWYDVLDGKGALYTLAKMVDEVLIVGRCTFSERIA